jgi:cell division septation protein DedD
VPFFARQNDMNKHQAALFTLPKQAKKTIQSAAKPSSSLNLTAGQIFYPLGQARLAPSLPKDASVPLDSANEPLVKSVIPRVQDSTAQVLPMNPAYLVDLRGFKSEQEAAAIIISLKKSGYNAKTMLEKAGHFKIVHVLVGPFNLTSEAMKVLNDVTRDKKISGVIRQLTLQDKLTDKSRK